MNDFTSLTQLVCNVIEAFTTTVFLPDESRKSLFLKSYFSLGNSVIKDVEIPFGHGLVGWVAENNTPVNVAHFQQDSKTLQFYSVSEDIQSFLAVPFVSGGSIGVLCVDSKKSCSFTLYNQKILTGFADQFSRLVKRERETEKFRQSREEGLEIELLFDMCRKVYFEKRKINILDALSRPPTELIPYDGCAVSILSEDQKKFFILRACGYGGHDLDFLKVDKDASLAGLVLKKGKVLNYPDLKKGSRKSFIFQRNEPDIQVKSFLGLPLKSGGRLIGVWSFTSDIISCYSPRHVKIATIISFLAASVLARPKVSAATISGG